jgi:hypothetical protein
VEVRVLSWARVEGESGNRLPLFFWCAQHGGVEEVKVLWGSWSQRPRANRKAKKPGNRSGREAGAERSGEQNREPTNRNRIRGAETQGERPNDREALVTNESSVDPAVARGTTRSLTWGELASRLKGRRADEARSEKSAAAVVARSAPTGMATRLLEVGTAASE